MLRRSPSVANRILRLSRKRTDSGTVTRETAATVARGNCFPQICSQLPFLKTAVGEGETGKIAFIEWLLSEARVASRNDRVWGAPCPTASRRRDLEAFPEPTFVTPLLPAQTSSTQGPIVGRPRTHHPQHPAAVPFSGGSRKAGQGFTAAMRSAVSWPRWRAAVRSSGRW